MSYFEELSDINIAIEMGVMYPEFEFLVSTFRKYAVITGNVDSNSLSDFIGWMDNCQDEFKKSKRIR